jgi:hypothetical protein
MSSPHRARLVRPRSSANRCPADTESGGSHLYSVPLDRITCANIGDQTRLTINLRAKSTPQE